MDVITKVKYSSEKWLLIKKILKDTRCFKAETFPVIIDICNLMYDKGFKHAEKYYLEKKKDKKDDNTI